jgi:translation initiation factor IF-3
MIDRDIWITAKEMIKLYGDDATVKAAIRADGLQLMDDEQGYATWKRVVAAINELKSTEPSGKVH